MRPKTVLIRRGDLRFLFDLAELYFLRMQSKERDKDYDLMVEYAKDGLSIHGLRERKRLTRETFDTKRDLEFVQALRQYYLHKHDSRKVHKWVQTYDRGKARRKA